MTILSMPAKEESFHTRIIAYRFDVVIIFLAHKGSQLLRLPDSQLQGQEAARAQMSRRHVDQPANHFVPAFASKQSDLRIVPDLARKRRTIRTRDIRQISDDQIVYVTDV